MADNQPTETVASPSEGFLNKQTIVPARQPRPILQSRTERLKSIDIMRGLTMFGMLVVNDQARTPVWPLRESEWNGLSTADLVFPSFLFIMGFAVPLAVRPPFKPLKFAIRVVGLFLVGYLLKLTEAKFDFATGRIPGVLQRISICYALTTAIHVLTRYGEKRRKSYGAMVVMVASAVYMGLMLNFDADCSRLRNLSPNCNFSRWLDLKIMRQANTMQPTDPEGIFSTLSALLTTYGGYRFCLIMKDFKTDKISIMREWFQWAIFAAMLSLCLSLCMPYNKKLWSTSFGLVTIGAAGLMLVLMVWLMDVVGAAETATSRWISVITRPFLWLGMNPLAIYVLNELTGTLLTLFTVKDGDSIWEAFYRTAFASWITNEQVGSTLFSVFWAVVWILVACLLHRFKIFIKL